MITIEHDTNRGIFNELLIIDAINGKKVKNTNILFQDLFYSFFKNIDGNSIVKAYKGKLYEKTDVIVKINNQIMNISVKIGCKNSVHCEGIYSFILFMKELKIPIFIINQYLYYHYADGTTNGSGKNRISVSEYKKSNAVAISNINKYFNQPHNIEKIANRFIFKGLNRDNSVVDIILWGPPNDFLWIARDDINNYLKKTMKFSSSGVHFGRLAVQPSNRCLNKNPKQEYKRKQVEVKWYNIFDSIIAIMNDKKAIDKNYMFLPD